MNEPLSVETPLAMNHCLLDKAPTRRKSFSALTIFTGTEINLQVNRCCKLKGKSIWKTSVRVRLFKNNHLYFYVKTRCKASMKNELRNVRIQLCKETGEVYVQSNMLVSCRER